MAPLNGNGQNGNGQDGKEFPNLFFFKPPAQVAPGKFPPKGWDFPRRYIEITPEEYLYDPGRILGTRVSALLQKTGEMVLRQPRLETTGLTQRETINDCPPPSQLPYIKRQIHLDPSRDAEIISCTHTIDVPALSSAIALAFDTFPTLRTIIRWLDVQVHDALCPILLREVVRIDCDPRKFIACPESTTTLASGLASCDFSAGTVGTPLALDFTNLPKDFHNSLYEITDRHHVDVVVINDAPADRRVTVTMWGWIESITAWDEVVKR